MGEPLAAGNFRLNQGNLRFLPYLVAAEASHGVPAAIVATIITAEAVMRPAGDDVAWDEFSRNDLGEAAGLAQFTRASWLAHASRAGSALNMLARERGHVGADDRPRDEAALLEMRYEPRLSVLLTAEMARRNWDALAMRGLSPDAFGPGALTKILYLAHHEGAGGAYRYLIGSRPAVSRTRFESNVPRQLWPTDGSGRKRTAAYYAWLEDYIDRRIDVRRYLVNAHDVTVPRLAALGRVDPHALFREWLRGKRERLREILRK